MITTKLVELLRLSPADRIARCEIADPGDTHFVPSECIMHLVRAARAEPAGPDFEKLYKILLTRILQRLPRSEATTGVRLKAQDIRDAVLDRLTERLAADRHSYEERLDYFEVRFDGALARLRDSAFKSEGRRTKRLAPLSAGDDGELSPEVETAALAAHEEGLPDFFLTDDCRSAVDTAIDSLPQDERAVIHMLRQGFPIDSKDPDQVTIRSALGKAERTVRNIRDRAIAKIKASLAEGGHK